MNAFSDPVSNVNMNQRSILFPMVYNMSMFGEINHFATCHLTSKYGPGTLTKKAMHTQVNSQHFEKLKQGCMKHLKAETVFIWDI